ncbi:MAG: hypothetical protein ACTHZ5_15985 [Micrococcaceae bacterium]
MTEPIPSRDEIRRQMERVRESQHHVNELLNQYAALTHRQGAAVRALEMPAGVDADIEPPEGATRAQVNAGRHERMTADTETDDGLDWLYNRLESLRTAAGASRKGREARPGIWS